MSHVRHSLLFVWAIAALLSPPPASAGDAASWSGCRPSVDGAALDTAKLRLGGATRDAFAAEPGREVMVSYDAGARVLVASIGATAAGVEFHIDAAGEAGWTSLWHGAAAPDAWGDHRIELPAAAGHGERRLRLRIAPGAAGDGAKAYWGSLRCLPVPPAGGEAPMNVVLISLDTLGAEYLGAYGGHAEASPHIDAFLARSFVFERAYAPYPNTLVSHASLFSGLYPSSHGVYGGMRNSLLGVELLSTVLRRGGYLNVAFTENAFVSSDFGFDEDFDWYDDGPERGDHSFLGDARETFGRARRWLETYGNDAPFLLFVHTYEVHSPYIARDDESRRIADGVFAGAGAAPPGISVADVEHLHNAGFERLSADAIRRLEALHIGEIHYLDRQFAELIEAIERMPFAARTLVVVFSDHGDEFDPRGKIGHGETLHDVVMHVPLAFYIPGQSDRLRRGAWGRPVSLVDVAPTVLDLLGMPGALVGDGRSLLPLLTGAAAELPPRPVFTELLKATGVCAEQRLDEDCFIGRFGVYSDQGRFEYSSVPRYESFTDADGSRVEGDVEQTVAFHALLSAYVTGRPWDTVVPWQPRAVAAERRQRQAIDDVTRQRLEALGYDF